MIVVVQQNSFHGLRCPQRFTSVDPVSTRPTPTPCRFNYALLQCDSPLHAWVRSFLSIMNETEEAATRRNPPKEALS